MTQQHDDDQAGPLGVGRPGLQALIEGALQGKFTIVVAEALDRLSRDQADVAALYRQLTFDSDAPLLHIHLSTDAPVDLHSVLFVPASQLLVLNRHLRRSRHRLTRHRPRLRRLKRRQRRLKALDGRGIEFVGEEATLLLE